MFGVYDFYKSENVTKQCNIYIRRIDLNHCKIIGHAGLFLHEACWECPVEIDKFFRA